MFGLEGVFCFGGVIAVKRAVAATAREVLSVAEGEREREKERDIYIYI